MVAVVTAWMEAVRWSGLPTVIGRFISIVQDDLQTLKKMYTVQYDTRYKTAASFFGLWVPSQFVIGS